MTTYISVKKNDKLQQKLHELQKQHYIGVKRNDSINGNK